MKVMKTLPIRLSPGQDLRAALEATVHSQNCREPDGGTGYDELVVRVRR